MLRFKLIHVFLQVFQAAGEVARLIRGQAQDRLGSDDAEGPDGDQVQREDHGVPCEKWRNAEFVETGRRKSRSRGRRGFGRRREHTERLMSNYSRGLEPPLCGMRTNLPC